MSYNPTIPVITDPILQSARQIKSNFQAIDASFADNHSALTNSRDIAGKHNVLTLRHQTLDPVTLSNEIAIYNKLVSSIPQVFFRPNNSQTPIQLTYQSIKADESNTQYSFIAGPFIVYGGFLSNPANNVLVTLTPVTTLIYVDVTTSDFKGVATVLSTATPTNVTGNQFNVQWQNAPGSTRDIYYIAVGLP